eukprot:4440279-Amphidinium_carterae.1
MQSYSGGSATVHSTLAELSSATLRSPTGRARPGSKEFMAERMSPATVYHTEIRLVEDLWCWGRLRNPLCTECLGLQTAIMVPNLKTLNMR